MTYSTASRWLDQQHPPVAPHVMQAWFEDRGRKAAPRYGENGQYTPVPPTLAASLHRACRRYAPVVVDVNLAAGQIDEETAGWQSFLARVRLNPGGIGAEDDDPLGKALAFETLDEALDAFVAHILTYCAGRGPWNAVDPRFKHVPAGNIGTRETVGSFAKAWATNPNYGEYIAARANNLLAFAAAYKEDPPVVRIPKPKMTSKPSPNRDGYGKPRQYLAFCDHIATGTKASNLSWLTNPASEASSNYYIAKDGKIFELVPYQHAPWTNGWKNDGRSSRPDLSNPIVRYCYDNRISPNVVTITIEHEGEPSDSLTQAQIDANCRLKAWLHQETGIPLDREHMLGHYQIDSINRPYCPSFTDAEWAALVNGARAIVAGAAAPPPPPAPVEDPNARKFEHVDYGTHWVINLDTDDGRVAMYDGWRQGGGLAGWGWPIGPMTRHADGVYRQAFENCLIGVYPKGFDGKSAAVIRKEGIPQNWRFISAFVSPIVEKWDAA